MLIIVPRVCMFSPLRQPVGFSANRKQGERREMKHLNLHVRKTSQERADSAAFQKVILLLLQFP